MEWSFQNLQVWIYKLEIHAPCFVPASQTLLMQLTQSRLPYGTRRSCLVLLHSCPDTVHRFPLRKTQTSTPLTQGSFAMVGPGQGITSAGADCRYRHRYLPGCVETLWQIYAYPVYLWGVFLSSSSLQSTYLIQVICFFHNTVCALLPVPVCTGGPGNMGCVFHFIFQSMLL